MNCRAVILTCTSIPGVLDEALTNKKLSQSNKINMSLRVSQWDDLFSPLRDFALKNNQLR